MRFWLVLGGERRLNWELQHESKVVLNFLNTERQIEAAFKEYNHRLLHDGILYGRLAEYYLLSFVIGYKAVGNGMTQGMLLILIETAFYTKIASG